VDHLTARDIMVRDVMTVGGDWSLGQLAEFFIENSISGAPVVASQDEKVIGVVSMTDLVRYEGNAHEPRPVDSHAYYLDSLEFPYLDDEIENWRGRTPSQARVTDIMTPVVFQVSVSAGIRQIAAAMIDRHIHRVLVTHNDRAIGIITAIDLLKVMRDHCF
jgi:predicted transcriptional regulator